MNLVLGVDPGLSGALALYDYITSSVEEVFDMPTIDAGVGSKRVVDESTLAWRIDALAKRIKHAFVEKVGAMPGQGVTSMFSFGTSYGIVRGVIAANFIPITLVTPQTWKKALGVPAAKDGARARASQLLPASSGLWCRVKDDGRAEASLIALYGAKYASR
jgi:crossover junction endodeoxyribonuclease RuvC